MALHYRPEIDGLRAFAVVPVILFHAGFSMFSGGFVGVDVFFVISGYLITSIIVRELEAGTWSFASFYERRARRILPALFLVLFCCIPFAWMWMTPSELKNFSNTLVSVVLFASNIRLWHQAGYFDAASEFNPLLHTWSLAVEEQFYVLFPVFLLLFWRRGRNASILGIALIALVSLVICEYASRNYPYFNFYWAITRVWELMAGSLCAFITIRSNGIRENVLSSIGLTLIIASIFLIDSSTRFPSIYTLAPVGGACLIILFCKRATLTARLLSSRPIVLIGLISYSAYLWHQPIFAFIRIGSVEEPSMLLMAAVAVIIFPLAWLTWQFVEMPFRSTGKAFSISRTFLIQLSAVTGIALTAFGVVGHVTMGFPGRFAEGSLSAQLRVRENFGLGNECAQGVNLLRSCRTVEEPAFLLWGDSYAMHLAGALGSTSPEIEFVQMTLPSCTPVLTHSHNSIFRSAEECGLFNREVLDYIKNSNNIKYVILSSPFNSILSGKLVDGRSGALVDGSYDLLVFSLKDTVRQIRALGKEVFIVAPPPTTGTNIGRCLLAADLFRRDESKCDFLISQWSLSTQVVYRALTALEGDVSIIWPHKHICSQGICKAANKEVWLYRDSGHFTVEGSEFLGKDGLFEMFHNPALFNKGTLSYP